MKDQSKYKNSYAPSRKPRTGRTLTKEKRNKGVKIKRHVHQAGLEPPTSRLAAERANQLRHNR